MQARKLRGQLQGMKLGPKALWVSSPLARALQTMLLACPQSELLGGACRDRGFRTAIRGWAPDRLGLLKPPPPATPWRPVGQA